MDEITTKPKDSESDQKAVHFSIGDYTCFDELPLKVLDCLPYPVYVISYDWVYRFVNEQSKIIHDTSFDDLVGKSALDVFQEPKFQQVFELIQIGIERRTATASTIHMPMYGQRIIVRGYALNDCYFVSTCTLPGKDELIQELREELRKQNDLHNSN